MHLDIDDRHGGVVTIVGDTKAAALEAARGVAAALAEIGITASGTCGRRGSRFCAEVRAPLELPDALRVMSKHRHGEVSALLYVPQGLSLWAPSATIEEAPWGGRAAA